MGKLYENTDTGEFEDAFITQEEMILAEHCSPRELV